MLSSLSSPRVISHLTATTLQRERERERERPTVKANLRGMECDSDECAAYDQMLEEEYIDMDVTSSSFLCYTTGSPPHSRDFEFHMSSKPPGREPITSPADELFYKGNLLPLHLPPRLQMVRRLLDVTSHDNASDPLEETIPTVAAATTTTTASTPFESCNISPASSCYVSGELNPEEYYECAAGFDHPLPKKSWSKKLKLIRQSSLGLKLKASREYLKSLFTRTAAGAEEPRAVRRAREFSSSSAKAGKKNPFGLIRWERAERHQMVGSATKTMDEEGKMEEECPQRRSFSGVIKHHLVNISTSSSSSSSSSSCSSSSSSSSSSTVNSNGHHGPATLKRSSSVNSEVECSIQGAIAYCKKSQQVACGRKSFSDVGCCTLSPSKVAAACET